MSPINLSFRFLLLVCTISQTGSLWAQSISPESVSGYSGRPMPGSGIADDTPLASLATSDKSLLHNAQFSDACLNAIAIINPDQHCVVGDNGTILITKTAGRSWRQVASPTRAHLYAVRFTDDLRGIAVGGTVGSYTRTSLGVVLQTIDGGETWRLANARLPRLRGLKWDGNRLFAFGDFDPSYRTSVFESTDLGNSWRPLPVSMGHTSALATLPPREVAVVDGKNQGLRFNLASQQETPFELEIGGQAPQSRSIRDIHFTGKSWVACRSDGQVQTSSDGIRWNPIRTPLSQEALRCCDWYSIHQIANQLWICGNPGSVLLHSLDAGATWRLKSTGQSLPLRHIEFLDGNRGFAVGALGTIIATRDGGENWYRQRGNSSSGIVAIGSPEQFPWVPLTSAVWETQVATVALLDSGDATKDHDDFLVSDSEKLLSSARNIGIHADHIANANTQDRDRTLVALASWDPAVVLCQESQAAALLGLTSQLSTSSHGLLTELKLDPPQIEKLVAGNAENMGQFSDQNQRVLQDLGLSIWDILSEFPPDIVSNHTHYAMRTVWTKSSNLAAQSSLFGAVSNLGQKRHEARLQATGNYQLVMGRAHRRRTLMQLLVNKSDLPSWKRDFNFILRNLPMQEVAPWLWESAEQLESVEHAERRELVLQALAAQDANSDAATWAMLELLKRTASSEWQFWKSLQASQMLTPESFASSITPTKIGEAGAERLDAGYLTTSSLGVSQPSRSPWDASPFESAQRNATRPISIPSGSPTPESITPESLRSISTSPVPSTLPETDGEPASQVFLASATATASNHPPEAPNAAAKRLSESEASSLTRWHELFGHFTQSRPDLLHRADLQVLRSRMLQTVSHIASAPAREILDELLQNATASRWHPVAFQELLLSANRLEDLKLLAVASYAAERPLLDGKFQDATWSTASTMRLSFPSITAHVGRMNTTVQWTYDQDYLYIAFQCPVAPQHRFAALRTKRSFDADLESLDHVRIRLDTDRDYHSWIELAVAEDGQTYDRCLGIPAFNPKWHVYAGQSKDAWFAEIAIEISDLIQKQDLQDSTWAVHLERVSEGQTVETFGYLPTSDVASPSTGAAFGLLHFAPNNQMRTPHAATPTNVVP